ncbi:general substrate transporter [Viridothelium virens]|uniref:General substrate transporter n=1 Tax=Viridothelium virens TaxID=1048519 RepID=A0A6A6GSH5_VIRVR|nr:general substrate transporter [Viridothelium virens]
MLRLLKGSLLLVLITIASCCGFLLFGYDNGVFSGIIVNPWFLKTFHHPSSSLLGTISALYNVGGFLGSTTAFFCGSKLGRKRTILSGIGICLVGAIVQSATTNMGELIAGRIICGLGVGLMTSTVGIYQAETVPAKTRGRWLTLQLLGGAALGLFFAQWINYGFHNTTGRVGFAFPIAFQVVFLAVSGFLIPLLPESPRWLVKHGDFDEALEVLIRLQGPERASERLAKIVEADTLEKQKTTNEFRSLFTAGSAQNFRRLCLACGIMVMHQLNGINSVTYYFPTLTQKFIGANHTQSLWISGLTSVDSILFALVPVLAIDYYGRRPFLVFGAAYQTASFAIIAALLALGPTHDSKVYGIAALVVMFLYYGVNAATWLGPSWAYPAEILPLQIREKGLALGNICYWLFQFLIVEITPTALANIGYRFYIILACFNLCSTLIVYFCYPETKSWSLEKLDFLFARNGLLLTQSSFADAAISDD